MDLPQDPYLLLSFVNMKLRDAYPTLAALCEDLGADEAALRQTLGVGGLPTAADPIFSRGGFGPLNGRK